MAKQHKLTKNGNPPPPAPDSKSAAFLDSEYCFSLTRKFPNFSAGVSCTPLREVTPGKGFLLLSGLKHFSFTQNRVLGEAGIVDMLFNSLNLRNMRALFTFPVRDNEFSTVETQNLCTEYRQNESFYFICNRYVV